jgi:hypothetical protein
VIVFDQTTTEWRREMKKNILLLTIAIFLACIFFAFPVQAQVGPALESDAQKHSDLVEAQATLVDHVMGLYPNPDCPTRPPEVTCFSSGDPVMNWVQITGCVTGDPYKWEFYDPNGQRYVVSNSIPSSGNYCLVSAFRDGVPNIKGNWYVDFYYQGGKLFRDTFQVGDCNGGIWSTVYDQLFADDEGALETLRSFRDEVLLPNPVGKSYVDRLYDRSHEVALILLLNPGLRAHTSDLLSDLLPMIESIMEGEEVQFSRRTLLQIQFLLNSFAKKASPELVLLIEDTKAALEDEVTMGLFGISFK